MQAVPGERRAATLRPYTPRDTLASCRHEPGCRGMAPPGLHVMPGPDSRLQQPIVGLLSGLKGAEQEHKQGDKKPASPHRRVATAKGGKPLDIIAVNMSGRKCKAAESLAFPRTAPARAPALARHGTAPLPPPRPRGSLTQPSCEAAPASVGLRALRLANERHFPGNHRQLHPPNLTLLRKLNCSHVKARAAGEQSLMFWCVPSPCRIRPKI